jgi:predicted small secreted protein
MQDGYLSFTMSSRPNTEWASDLENRPVSAITDHLITPLPYFIAKSNAFQDKMSVKLGHVHKDAVITYAIEPNKMGFVYRPGIDSIQVDESIRINATAISSRGVESKTVFAQFKKIHHSWKVFYKEPYSSQYTAGGDMALIDWQYGGPNFRTGSWQGFHGNDLDVTIDMGRNQGIREIAVTFLHDQRSWIFLPERVEFMVSDKNYDFRTVAIIENRSPSDLSEAFIEEFKKDKMKEYGRFVRIRANNRKTCPEWHVGAGEKAWIFIDELVVE